jgi:hypothetical protein
MALSGVAQIQRLGQRDLQAVGQRQARPGERFVDAGLGQLGRRRVVGMWFQRGDGDVRPLVPRQRSEQAVELAFAVGAVQTDYPGPAASDGPPPDPDEMPIISESVRGGCLGTVAGLDLGRRSPVRNVDLELDQEFYGFLLSGWDSDGGCSCWGLMMWATRYETSSVTSPHGCEQQINALPAGGCSSGSGTDRLTVPAPASREKSAPTSAGIVGRPRRSSLRADRAASSVQRSRVQISEPRI